MKKIIALALALIMALSMASVAFAAEYAGNETKIGKAYYTKVDMTGANKTTGYDLKVAPGTALYLDTGLAEGALKDYKVSYDFTKGTRCGASLIESVKVLKTKDDVVLTIKESSALYDEAKEVSGVIELTKKGETVAEYTLYIDLLVNNNVEYAIGGAKKLADADPIVGGADTVVLMDEDGGLVTFGMGQLDGYVKMNKDEKVFFELTDAIDEDTKDAIDAYLGEDYDAIVEWFNFAGKDFANNVDFYYDAYEEDPHFFYAWDGEKFVDLEAKFDDDEDVMAYVWTGDAEGIIIVTDVEIVAAAEEETKNPDTGANDVVGVAAALAVVSLVAAGAVSLKK